ncbi:MAG: hypothetical protein KDK41_00180 [Leptospiraceae bacterium]|nr:hypothetical protein [Leptospiraceae bacterium]
MRKTVLTAFILCMGMMLMLHCASVPSGAAGPQAEELTDKMLEAAGMQQWKQTAAVSFTFSNGDQIFWDKNRDLVEVISDEIKVQLRKSDFKAIALSGEEILQGEKRKEAIDDAWAKFINHTFWLSPMFHARSPGAVREYQDGQLIVKFSSGGVTPGDTYLFMPKSDFKIDKMQMWVDVIPIKGAVAEFLNYTVTETGVPIALTREMSLVNINIENLKMFAKYPVSAETDRFSALLSDN